MLRTWLSRPQHALVSIRQHNPTIIHSNNGGRRDHSDARQPPFTYKIAVSSSPKRDKLKPAGLGKSFWTQAHVDRDTPTFVSQESYSGQDAFFIAHIAKSRRHVVFSVADGVGGWEEQGVNPAFFSHGLCRYMAAATLRPEKEQDVQPLTIMNKGHDGVQGDKKIEAGGSTASVATLEPSGYMEVANLGDSGFVVLSPGKVSYKFHPQTSAFNTPYQLSKLTQRMKQQQAIFGGTPIQDLPSRSDVTQHDLNHGDVVVFGTDGLWDNLSAMEVLNLVSRHMVQAGHWNNGSAGASVNKGSLGALLTAADDQESDLTGQMAYAIMKEAKVLSHDTRRDGPFAKEVHRYFPNEHFHGGKVDDIAVIVCIAVQDGHDKIKAKL